MKRGDILIRALTVTALVATTAGVGCKSSEKSSPAAQRTQDQNIHAGSGARYSGESNAPPVDQTDQWPIDRSKLLPPSPLRGQAKPVAKPGGCIPAGYVVGYTAFPTGNPATSAILVEKGVPPQVIKGQEFDFIICATNLTNHDLNNVIITDVISDGWELRSSTPKFREDMTSKPDNVYVWDLQTIAPGATESITIRAYPTQEGTINACATVEYEAGICVATDVVSPALKLAKTGPPEALACDEVAFTLRVTNTGTGHANNVVITDDLPSGLTTQSGKGEVRIALDRPLGPGESREFSVPIQFSRTGRFESTAKATADLGLTATSAPLAIVIHKPVLDIAQRCDEEMYLGRNADTDITVTNKGDGLAKGVVLEAVLPAGTAFASASDNGRLAGGKVTWSLGDLAPKASKKVNLAFSSTAPGSFKTSATASSACADPVSTSCSTLYKGIPAILVECIDLEDPDEVGTTETYVITVTNQGSAPDSNIRLVCVVPDKMSYVSSTGPTDASARGQTVTFSPLASLAPKDKAVWRVTVRGNEPGDVRFEIKVTSDQFKDPPIMETESTNLYR